MTKGAFTAPFDFARTPDGGHRILRVGIAAPVGVQVHRAIVQVAVHAGHVLPRLVVVLGDASLYISPFCDTEVRRIQLLNFIRNPFQLLADSKMKCGVLVHPIARSCYP